MSAPSSRNPIQIPGFGTVAPGSADDTRLGALLGMAVGDALGTTYEFARLEQAPYPALATGPATDIVGGGPFYLAPGQITDDTQMAICIARSLLASRDAAAGSWFDCVNPHDLAMRYVAWSAHAFDIGSQTATAIRYIATREPVLNAGRAVWHGRGRRAAGNGSLMRTAPLGVALAACPIEQIVEGALTDSLITHADPRCLLAVAAFDVAIARAIAVFYDAREPMTEDHDARDAMSDRTRAMLAAARDGLSLAAARMRELWRDDADDLAAIASAEIDLTRDLDAATADEPGVYGGELDVHETAGFVRVAFRLAFWHLVHTPWRDAVVDVASRGGDADTNAAIVGALVGARDGVSRIPASWVERVLDATQPGPAEWADAHHPRHLVALAAAMR